MALTGGYRIHIQLRVQDKLCSFGLAYQMVSGGDPATDASFLSQGWVADNQALLLDCLAVDTTFEGVYTVCLLPEVAMPDRTPGSSLPGTRSGNALPANSCAVITLQTEAATAVRQGRIYLSGISKDDVTSGLFSAAFTATELTDFADSLKEFVLFGGQSFQPMVVQRVIAGVPIAGNLLPVSGTRVRNIPYTQRRRTTKQLGYSA